MNPKTPGAASEPATTLNQQTPLIVTDQPTIITGRNPMPAPALSDSTHRILEGRVMPGDRLEHFELVEYVGGGGMGRVFRALDTQLGRTVALKVLTPEQAADPDALQRFQNEAQSSARLDHDNIARAYYVGEDRGLHFIVFEFVEGENVRTMVERRGPLPLAEVVSYTLQVAEALAHAHARSVVHRDIKPSNVLITPEGRVKLIDMGLARLRTADPAAAELTASGVTLGTFDYISPEQARDPRNADIRSDIYSLGCTVFYMLAGQPPFPEGTVLQKLLQHQGDAPPDIRQSRPELPDELARVLGKMMEKDPRRRYANPTELTADLLLLADRIGLRPVSPSSRVWLVPQEPSTSWMRRHLPWLLPVVALVGIVVLLDRYWRDDEPSPPVQSAGSGLKSPPSPNGKRIDASAVKKNNASPEPKTAEQTVPSSSALTLGTATVTTVLPPPSDSPPETSIESSFSILSPARRVGTLVVCANPHGDEQYATLEAACAAANDGDAIELRFNGPREERPLKIGNLNLTIRAGDGFAPVVVFRPTNADPVKYPRSMFMLGGGRLTLVGAAFELHVPHNVPADNWSMFETQGGALIRLERCWLTVQNVSAKGTAYHQDVAMFRVRLSPDAEMGAEGAPSATPLATIEMADSVVRGEADGLRVEDVQPVHLTVDDGLLILGGRLLSAGGGATAPKLDEVLRVELRDTTALAQSGLCWMVNTTSRPHQLTAQLVATHSILMVSSGSPLIEQEGSASVEDFRQRFIWNGDRNFYQGVSAFWTIRNIDFEAPPETMDFEAWETYWGPSREIQPSVARLKWRRPPAADRPLHACGPGDYTLDSSMFRDAASQPGCRPNRLLRPASGGVGAKSVGDVKGRAD
ncbi:MAG: serine/threonine-protein kinase [Thermoguttaceae bacterium]